MGRSSGSKGVATGKRISKEEAERILRPYYEIFVSIMKEAHKDWKTVAGIFAALSARTRASFINDRIRDGVREQFGIENVVEPKGSFFLRIESIALRFKKLKGSRPINNPTNQTDLIESGEMTLGEALDRPSIVHIGYVPDASWDKFRYEISCIINKRVEWTVDVTPEVEAENLAVPIEEGKEEQKKDKRVSVKPQ